MFGFQHVKARAPEPAVATNLLDRQRQPAWTYPLQSDTHRAPHWCVALSVLQSSLGGGDNGPDLPTDLLLLFCRLVTDHLSGRFNYRLC